MCIIDIDDKNNLYLLPMSTFKEKNKDKIVNQEVNFEYSKIHGNTQDAYIKCNQVYVLRIEDFNNINKIKLKYNMNNERFNELIKFISLLVKNKKIYKKTLNFNKCEVLLNKKLNKENPN